MFDIQLGDILCFTLVEENIENAMEVDEQGEEEEDIEEEQNEDMNTFQITVYSVVDNEKQQKNFVAPAGDFWNCTYFKQSSDIFMGLNFIYLNIVYFSIC